MAIYIYMIEAVEQLTPPSSSSDVRFRKTQAQFFFASGAVATRWFCFWCRCIGLGAGVGCDG